jgi:cysteinyl-tRNA synthetase
LIEGIIEIRQRLRADKHFDLADEVRNVLNQNGVILEDKVNGTDWRITD